MACATTRYTNVVDWSHGVVTEVEMRPDGTAYDVAGQGDHSNYIYDEAANNMCAPPVPVLLQDALEGQCLVGNKWSDNYGTEFDDESCVIAFIPFEESTSMMSTTPEVMNVMRKAQAHFRGGGRFNFFWVNLTVDTPSSLITSPEANINFNGSDFAHWLNILGNPADGETDITYVFTQRCCKIRSSSVLIAA